jgi:hypothetical protein
MFAFDTVKVAPIRQLTAKNERLIAGMTSKFIRW